MRPSQVRDDETRDDRYTKSCSCCGIDTDTHLSVCHTCCVSLCPFCSFFCSCFCSAIGPKDPGLGEISVETVVRQANQELAVAAGPFPPAVPPPPHLLDNREAEDLGGSDPEHASCRTAPAVISTASGSNEPPHEPLRLVPAPDAPEDESTETEEPIDPDVPIVLRPPREDHPHRWVSQVDMQLPEAPTVHKVYGKGGSVPTGMLQIREQEKSRTPRGETTAIPITHPSVGLRPPHYFPAPIATEMIPPEEMTSEMEVLIKKNKILQESWISYLSKYTFGKVAYPRSDDPSVNQVKLSTLQCTV